MQNQAYILCIETSGECGSVCVTQNKKVLAIEEVTIEKSHSEKIIQLIQNACQKVHIRLSQLSAVAVSVGPGSYTGLRIASSTAKGLCYGLNIPLIGIDTLLIMAKMAAVVHTPAPYSLICPMIDARRQEVFCAMYSLPSLELALPHCAEILTESSFNNILSTQAVLFCGNGSSKFKELYTSHNAVFAHNIYPSAHYMAEFACEKFYKQQWEDTVNFEPFYLKEFYMPTKQ